MKTIYCGFLLLYALSFAQTPITDANFHHAIATCLATNPSDGLCYSSEYGAMPNWDVSQVTDMSIAFDNRADFNADISGWDVSNVTNMAGMFGETWAFEQDIGGWDVSSVTDMHNMFWESQFNGDISNWDVSNVTDMSGMFFEAVQFNQDLSAWDIGSVTDLSIMFNGAISFNGDISGWNTSKVTNMSGMFGFALVFNQNIGGWDTSQVLNMSGMFDYAQAFDQSLGTWDISNVTNMDSMLWDVTLSTTNYDNTLIGWAAQPLQSNIIFNGGNSTYCNSSAARDVLINTFNWIISDGGFDCSTLDVAESNALTLSIIENPATDYLKIRSTWSIDQIILFDSTGRFVFKEDYEQRINISHLPSGMYLVGLYEGQKRKTARLIKR